MQSNRLSYVLITAARNEAGFIENTIRSVVAQTRCPKKWVIVSDGSTDRTDDIVKEYAGRHEWIELLRMPERHDRQFAAKVQCLKTAYNTLRGASFEVVASLDADITFEEDYMAFLLDRLAENDSLGVVGTRFIENSSQVYNYKFMNAEHVSGGCQVFRRVCFEEVGGYLPLRGGGEDWAAVTSARMKGWQTRSYTTKLFVHHRPMGTHGRKSLSVQFSQGQRDYLTGGHPLWQLFRSVFQMSRKPYLFGGLCLLLGYVSCWLRQVERPVPKDLIVFHRSEQMTRLRNHFFNRSKHQQVKGKV